MPNVVSVQDLLQKYKSTTQPKGSLSLRNHLTVITTPESKQKQILDPPQNSPNINDSKDAYDWHTDAKTTEGRHRQEAEATRSEAADDTSKLVGHTKLVESKEFIGSSEWSSTYGTPTDTTQPFDYAPNSRNSTTTNDPLESIVEMKPRGSIATIINDGVRDSAAKSVTALGEDRLPNMIIASEDRETIYNDQIVMGTTLEVETDSSQDLSIQQAQIGGNIYTLHSTLSTLGRSIILAKDSQSTIYRSAPNVAVDELQELPDSLEEDLEIANYYISSIEASDSDNSPDQASQHAPIVEHQDGDQLPHGCEPVDGIEHTRDAILNSTTDRDQEHIDNSQEALLVNMLNPEVLDEPAKMIIGGIPAADWRLPSAFNGGNSPIALAETLASPQTTESASYERGPLFQTASMPETEVTYSIPIPPKRKPKGSNASRAADSALPSPVSPMERQEHDHNLHQAMPVEMPAISTSRPNASNRLSRADFLKPVRTSIASIRSHSRELQRLSCNAMNQNDVETMTNAGPIPMTMTSAPNLAARLLAENNNGVPSRPKSPLEMSNVYGPFNLTRKQQPLSGKPDREDVNSVPRLSRSLSTLMLADGRPRSQRSTDSEKRLNEVHPDRISRSSYYSKSIARPQSMMNSLPSMNLPTSRSQMFNGANIKGRARPRLVTAASIDGSNNTLGSFTATLGSFAGMLIQAGTPVRDALPSLYHCARVTRIEQGLWGLAEELPKVDTNLELIISPLYTCPAGSTLRFMEENEFIHQGKFIFMYNPREEDPKPITRVDEETVEVIAVFPAPNNSVQIPASDLSLPQGKSEEQEEEVAIRKVGKLANILGLETQGEILNLKDHMGRTQISYREEAKRAMGSELLPVKSIKKLTERLGTTANELPALMVEARNRTDPVPISSAETEKPTKLSPALESNPKLAALLGIKRARKAGKRMTNELEEDDSGLEDYKPESEQLNRARKMVAFFGVPAEEIKQIRQILSREEPLNRKREASGTKTFLCRIYFANQTYKSLSLPITATVNETIISMMTHLRLKDDPQQYGLFEISQSEQLLQPDQVLYERVNQWKSNEMFLFRRHAYRVRADEVVEPTEDGDSLERDSNIMDEYEQDRRDVEDIVRPMLTEENSSVNSYVQPVTIDHIGVQYRDSIAPMAITDFEFHRVLGRGKFGKVLLCSLRSTNQVFAIKVISKAKMDAATIEASNSESAILRSLQHPFIVELHFAFQTKERLYLVMDFLAGGEIYFHVNHFGRLGEYRACFYAAEILLAMQFIHASGIVYRDLKLENILLGEDGHIKITDFGLSTAFAEESAPVVRRNFHQLTGTYEYLSPEILRGYQHSPASDIWAYGVVLFEMLTAQHPFYSPDRHQLVQNILHVPLPFHHPLSPMAIDLLQRILTREIEYRITSEEIMNHVFFDGLNWDDLLNKQISPPFVPNVQDTTDTGFFDAEFTEQPIQFTPISTKELARVPSDAFANFSYRRDYDYN